MPIRAAMHTDASGAPRSDQHGPDVKARGRHEAVRFRHAARLTKLGQQVLGKIAFEILVVQDFV